MSAEDDISSITVTQALIDGYARLSGDFNPLHVDPWMAGATRFGGTIAHGCIPMEPIFKSVKRVLGRPVLPDGTKMSLRYLRPSQPGDTIHLEPQGEAWASAVGELAFACVNQRGEKVIEGTCLLPGLPGTHHAEN